MNGLKIRLSDVSWADPGKSDASCANISNVEMDVSYGQISAIVGPSGVGKTTILKAISGWHSALTVKYAGISDIESRKSLEIGDIFLLPQSSSDIIFPWYTVKKNILISRIGSMQNESPAEVQDKLEKLVAQLGFESVALQKRAHQLSGGMQRRLAIGMALFRRPALLLLDEPLVGLNDALRSKLSDLFRAYVVGAPKRSIIMVTHEARDVRCYASSALRLSEDCGDVTVAERINKDGGQNWDYSVNNLFAKI